MQTGLPAAQEVFIMMQSPHNTQEGTPFLRLVDPGQNKAVLPVGTDKCTKHNEGVLTAVGIKILGDVGHDNLLQWVELPAGWKKVVGDRTVYSHIVDSKSRKRVEIILHQAGSSKQTVFMYLCRRYGRSFDHDRFCDTNVGVTNVTDDGQVIYTTKPIVAPKGDESEQSNAAAAAWLDEHYPEWHKPDAYWD